MDLFPTTREHPKCLLMSGHDAVMLIRDLLGFTSCLSTCHCGWNLVHYLCDSVGFSALVANALRALLNEEMFRLELLETINERTNGKRPTNWTPLFLLCDGLDKNYAKADLVDLTNRISSAGRARSFCFKMQPAVQLAERSGGAARQHL